MNQQKDILQNKTNTIQAVANAVGKEGKVLTNNRPIQKKANNTGLPDNLKSGIENLSGHAMDDVKVHYNSDKPAQLNAHAYAQGTNIHIASGQEKHLPHEAWHVVQQKQGRVKRTMQMKGKVNVNDDIGLEKEADIMGAKAIQRQVVANQNTDSLLEKNSQDNVAQRTVLSKVYDLQKGGTKIVYYSTYDTSQEFDNQFDAWKLDTKLAKEKEKEGEFDEEQRYPTNFTHYNTASRNIPPPNGKAGPHTLSHSSLSFRLSKKIKTKSLKELRDEQVPNLDEYLDLLMTEAPSKIKSNQIERLLEDYKLSYNRLDQIIKGEKETYKGEGHELLMRLIQLHPYTVYGKGKSVSKSRIKGKGERKEDKFEEAFDEKAKFNSEENYSGFKWKRKKLYDDSEDSEEEDKLKKIKKLEDTKEGEDTKEEKDEKKIKKEDEKKEKKESE